MANGCFEGNVNAGDTELIFRPGTSVSDQSKVVPPSLQICICWVETTSGICSAKREVGVTTISGSEVHHTMVSAVATTSGFPGDETTAAFVTTAGQATSPAVP